MIRSSTGLLKGLRLVYTSYGGFDALRKSEYVWVSFTLTLLCINLAANEDWTNIAVSTMPTIAGFSMASYAVFFAVLTPSDREALRKPDPALDDKSPLLALVSSVSHAVIIQIFSLLIAVVYKSSLQHLCKIDEFYWYIFSFPASVFGLFVFIYGVILVLGPMIVIFRLMEIQSKL